MSQYQKLVALPLPQLELLYKDVVSALKDKRRMTARQMGNVLVPGARVSFTGSKSGAVSGKVLEVKQTKCVVLCDTTNKRWNVPMQMLTVHAIRPDQPRAEGTGIAPF